MIYDIKELESLFDKSDKLENFLPAAVQSVAYHMQAAVCSIYLYDAANRELVLCATQGLSQNAVGRVRLKIGEGIVGQSLQESRPINIGRLIDSASNKPIQDIGEENYQSFLAVPILRGLTKVGVLVVQDTVENYFTDQDKKEFRSVASYLATVIENAQLLLNMHNVYQRQEHDEPDVDLSEELKFLKGRTVSNGVAYGEAIIIADAQYDVLVASADDHDLDTAIEVFEAAISETEKQLKELQTKLDEQMADVASMIFSAHILILRDSEFFDSMRNLVEEGYSPHRAVTSVVNDFINLFSQSSNPRMQEKVQDVKDLGHRILQNIEKQGEEHTGNYEGQIVIAQELMPSEFVKLAAQNVEGMVIIAGGGETAHISILARSLQKPVVFVNDYRLLEVLEETPVLMDANSGTVFVEPDDSVLESYADLLKGGDNFEDIGEEISNRTFTRDGTRIRLLSNINLLSDVKVAQSLKAEGVGLYRSEFPFIVRNSFPTENEQYNIYRRIIEGMPGKEVVLRTLDVGGDKVLPYSEQMHEANPFLGLRAIRFTLANRNVFSQQLRAMLRAGHDTDMRILFPFISSLDDYDAALAVVKDCIAELDEEGVDCQHEPKIGCMVELPSALSIIDELAEVSDFLCIGTNDLIQYLLAVDRTNEAVSDLYISHHPAVLRALRVICDAAAKADCDLSICGDAAADAHLIPFLIGIGLRKFSMDPRMIPSVQSSIKEIEVSEAEDLARHVLKLGRITDVGAYLGIGNT